MSGRIEFGFRIVGTIRQALVALTARYFKIIGSLILGGAAALPAEDPRAWGEFAEPGFPWLAATVDARESAGGAVSDNVIVRGVILFLGEDTYACYDTDLVRLALVWKGDFLDYRSMASHTYYRPGNKVPGGQQSLNRPLGEVVSACGLYPGGYGSRIELSDPRLPAPDPGELGRGPIPASLGQWRQVRVNDRRALVEYSLQGVVVRESLEPVAGEAGMAYVREFQVASHRETLQLVLGESFDQVRWTPDGRRVRSLDSERPQSFEILSGDPDAVLTAGHSPAVCLRLPPDNSVRRIRVLIARGKFDPENLDRAPMASSEAPSAGPTTRRWPETVTTKGRLGTGTGYVVDELTLPSDNPWKRQVRTADLTFLPDGRAAVVTFDGDVWIVSGIDRSLAELQWRRVASGLHEPQSINCREGQLFVYTRNGLIRLEDRDGDGEIDGYETFSNRFTQTAETREFANDSVVTADGGFLLAKPGQQPAHRGRDNGSILKVSADGRRVVRLADGFRQPYLGYRAATGRITASDQQGHWVPTTPIHWVREDRFYGFRPPGAKLAASRSITEPLCWIPHRVLPSAAGQVWLDDERFGPLANRLVCLDYHRSRLLVVHPDFGEDFAQGAVSLWPVALDQPLLKGEVNPADGALYLTGFRIWGSVAKTWNGIRRIRYAGGEVNYPVGVRSVKEGLILEFALALSEASAGDRANYHVSRWNYRRTGKYGSGHFRTDGQPGTEIVGIGGAILSRDRRSVLITLPEMRPVMQLEIAYRLTGAAGEEVTGAAYATVHGLRSIDLAAAGFSPSEVAASLSENPERLLAADNPEVSVARGRQVFELAGCQACHSLDGTMTGRSGPSLQGVFGKRREFADGSSGEADERYLRESILNPEGKVLKAFAASDIGMPSYQGVLTEAQIESVIAFLKSR